MKLTSKIMLMTCIGCLITAKVYAAGEPDNHGADVNLVPETIPVYNPQIEFPHSTIVNTPSHTDFVVGKIREAGNAAIVTTDKLLEKTKSAQTEVTGKLNAEADPVTRAILRTQLVDLGNLEKALNTTRAGAKTVANTTRSYSGRAVWLGGQLQIASSWDQDNHAQVNRLNAEMVKLTATVDKVINSTTDESTAARVGAAKATLTKGTAATGGVLTAPGAVAGDEKIIVTEGVTNRTIPGQHGDLLMHGIGSGEAILRETTALGETKRNASLLMLGEHQEAKISAGESAILIGDNSKTEGNGIAIGKNATSGNDSIALGNNSVTTGANELSIGNENGLTRKITHMADGTNDSDGATIHNLKSEISRLDTIALDYADTKKEQAITVANQYTDAAKTAAIDVANQYTDNKITTLDTQAQGYATAAKSEAVKDANQYSDDTAQKTLKSANDYTERRAVVAENNAVTRSNAYTDESSSRTLESANTYTNHRSVQAENNAVARSNAYTDNRFGELKHQVDRNEKRANGGIAGAMAMSGIVPVPGNDFSFGIATSGYRDQGAIATGVQARISPNANINMKAAWDSGNGVGVVAGLNIGW
ncbi:hypothetical protein DSO52_19430 [Salmonella enterica]|nr:hypothetical protein [Salmonella enterica]